MTTASNARVLIRNCLNNYLFAAAGILLFVQGALTQIDLPGIYLDAVNPDYIVLRLLEKASNTPYWALPGNLIYGKFPVLIQIYHGALPFYVGLPVYLLFGTGLVGIRLANLLFGLLVLSGFAVSMRALKMNALVAGLALAALALDSGFLFAFRTQFYITTLPLALFFASLALSNEAASSRRLAVAGALAGLSVYGYFCFAFLLPSLAWRVWRLAPRGEWLRNGLAWSLGVAIGVSPYLLGLSLVLVNQRGVGAFLEYFHQYFHDIAVANPMSLAERWHYAITMIIDTTRAIGPMTMMTNGMQNYAPVLKSVLLLGGPGTAFLLSLWPHIRWQAAQGAAIGVAGVMGLFVIFGHRAWLHHAAAALPLMYMGLAALADQISARWSRRGVVLLASLPLAALVWVNAVDRLRAENALERTGGVNFFSDALTHFEQDAARGPRNTQAFFPDWGLIFPFAMVNGGEIPVESGFSPESARRALCSGRDALVAIMADSSPERMEAWRQATDWPEPQKQVYLRRDGTPAVIALRWKASDKPPTPCN